MYVLGTPLVLMGLALVLLHTGWGKARVRALLLERVRERVHGQVELGVVDYTLFGEIRLGDLHIKDPQGTEAVALTSLTLRPSWGDLLTGGLVIDGVALSGLTVHVIKDADGSSNLARLLVPRPEDPAKKPLDRRVEVKAISLTGVQVDVAQPDGTKIVLSDAAVSGALSVLPSEKAADIEIGKIALSVLVDKGEGGLKLGLTGLETGVTVKLEKGAGTATLHPLKGHVALTLPEKGERGFDIGLAGFTAEVGDGGVGVSLDKLLAGALALASVEVKGKLQDGKMDGSQQADVLGLTLAGARVNELLGRDVLLGDIAIETHLLGPPDKIAVATKITTPGAALHLDGVVGVADPANPTYEVTLGVTDIDTVKLLAPALGIAPVTVEKVKASVKGSGRSVAGAGAVATLEVSGATVRGVRIDGITFAGDLQKGILHVRSLEANALGQRLTASGEIELATKRIDLTAGLEGDVGEVLGRLKAAGLPLESSLPRGAVRLPPGDLTVSARGFLGGAIDVQVAAKKLNVFGGSVGLDARASLIRHDPPLDDGKKVTVSALDADLKLGGVKLSSLLAMRGKKLEGMEGVLSGEVHVEGSPEQPRAKLLLGLATSRADGGKTVRLSLSGDVTRGSADIKASLVPTGEAAEALGVTARLPLSLGGARKGIDPYRPFQVHVSLPKRSFAEVWALLPDGAIPARLQAILDGGLNLKLIPGDVALDLDLKGTAAKPDGTLRATLQARALPIFSQIQKVELVATVKPAVEGAPPQSLTTKVNLGFWLDNQKARLVQVDSDVHLSRSPALGAAELAHHTGITVGPTPFADFFMDGDLQALGGTLLASITLDGNREDLRAHALVNADGVRPRGIGPLGVGALVDVGDEATSVDVKVRVPAAAGASPDSPALLLAGNIGLAGKKLFEQLRAQKHRDAPLALRLDIPQRALASLAWITPEGAESKLAGAPGDLSGAIPITGTVKTPLARGSIQITGVARADGATGGAALAIDAGADELLARVGIGVPDAAKAPLQITVHARREDVAKLGEGATLPVFATIRADKADLRQLLPAALAEGTRLGFAGTLDWNMDLEASLARPAGGKKTELLQGSVSGLLDLRDATISLPGTKRAYRDAGLRLTADAKGLHLDTLHAKESDAEVQERTILLKGDVGLDRLKPTTATLSLAADRWLLFGPRSLGKPDAPRGTLTLAATAKADFTKPVRAISASVHKLELLVPERFERAHQPEDVHAGDLVFLGEDRTALGKLVVPASVEKKGPSPAELAALKREGKEEGYDIDVHIADGVHLLQAPIDLWPKGDVSVKIRPWGREIKAAIELGKGGLSLGGVAHGLVKGSILFDEKNPKGFLDMTFERPMRAAALRQISEASGGTAVRVHMFGPLSERKTVLSGAGTAGSLWDVLAMHNTGRARYVSEPDLPWSMSAEFPQHDNLLVLGFLAVNLPHLLFVDRFAVWGDPYDDPRAYGKLTHLEAERFTPGNTLRFRLGARPPSAGQSEAEAEIDYVIVNVPRMLLGVGLTGGTRGGGGPGLVWEWSSKD